MGGPQHLLLLAALAALLPHVAAFCPGAPPARLHGGGRLCPHPRSLGGRGGGLRQTWGDEAWGEGGSLPPPEGYSDVDDLFRDMPMLNPKSFDAGGLGKPGGFNLVWDGHDAFITERFRCPSHVLAGHVTQMMSDNDSARIQELLVRYGEEPRMGLSVEEMGERLLKLAFLSAGLRQILEDDILGTTTKQDTSGLLAPDFESPEGMRPEIRRRTPLTPNARSTPSQRQQDDEEGGGGGIWPSGPLWSSRACAGSGGCVWGG